MSNIAIYQKCIELVISGYDKEAKDLLVSAIEGEQSAEALSNLGASMWEIGQYECAEIAFLRALEIEEHPATLYNYAINLDDAGRHCEALVIIKRFAQFDVGETKLNNVKLNLMTNYKQHLADEIQTFLSNNTERIGQKNGSPKKPGELLTNELQNQLARARKRYKRKNYGKLDPREAVRMSQLGFKFTVDEIVELGNPAGPDGFTIAEYMAYFGYQFTIEELLKLEETGCNRDGASSAHIMARRGHSFSFDEITKLGNPANLFGETLAHLKGYFTFDQLMKLGNQVDIKGQTIAHIMAEKGHCFSIDELMKLGNPADKTGRTIAHVMAENGYQFTFGEISKLGHPVYDILEKHFRDLGKTEGVFNLIHYKN